MKWGPQGDKMENSNKKHRITGHSARRNRVTLGCDIIAYLARGSWTTMGRWLLLVIATLYPCYCDVARACYKIIIVEFI